MVAAHIRRRKGPVRYRFQALYELDNMAVVEMKDSDAASCCFKILMFPDSHLYQVSCVCYMIHCTYAYMYTVCTGTCTLYVQVHVHVHVQYPPAAT